MGGIAQKILKEYGVKVFNELPLEIRRHINVAIHDLYHGPIYLEEDDYKYPGFSEACDIIRGALSDIDDIYINVPFEEVLTSEPEWYAQRWKVVGPDSKTIKDDFEDEASADSWGNENAPDDWNSVEYSEAVYSEGDIYKIDRKTVLAAITNKELVDYIK